jgi:hypothetical protein
MADQPGPAQPGKGIPMWVILGGVGVVVVFLYMRRKGGAGAAGTAAPLVPGVTTDPNTGLPVDPLTGLPYITNPTKPPDNNSWGLGAEQWLSTHGVSASLANQAIYDYLNGNLLNANESGAIDKVLAGYGFPPNELPFGGAPVLPKPTPTPAPKPGLPHVTGNFPQTVSALQHKLIGFNSQTQGVQGGAPVYALVKNTAFGPVYEQGQAVADVQMYGGTLYTLPEFKAYITAPKKAA